ncbi:MAG: hypothetical protein N2C12_16805, partial [Planctomycetales bacterium]
MKTVTIYSVAFLSLFAGLSQGAENDPIQHDAEYAILKAQNGEAWAADDQAIDEKLAELRNQNGGKPPNIVYIL